MKKFMDSVEDKTNKTLTENMAVTRKSSGSDVLDFFSKGGALRTRSDEEIISIFTKAFAEDKELALRCLFYLRDIRGGQGERRVFRVIYRYLAKHYPKYAKANFNNVPEYGRWDDLYSVFDTKLEADVANFMQKQLDRDITAHKEDRDVSLLAKWLKSENASSEDTKYLARKTIDHFGMTPRTYRKILSKLRKKIGVVERKMSANNWSDIEFSNVPSKASMIYRNAFQRNAPAKYEEYIEKVMSGEETINADTLFPYEIVRLMLRKELDWGTSELEIHEKNMLNEQWKALPQYNCTEENSIAVIDVSGSMHTNDFLPLSVAISLGIYLAEHNSTPALKDRFITFSGSPDLVKLQGNNLYERVMNCSKANWSMNTDIEAVFDLILNTALENNLSNEEIPQKLYIISDMEFDRGTSGWGKSVDATLFEKLEQKYRENGYDLPLLVFWNVDSRNDQMPVKQDSRGFLTVSGCSPHTFKFVVDTESVTPYDLMKEVLMDDRYGRVVVDV